MTFRGPGSESRQAYWETLAGLVARQEQLQEQLSTRSASFRSAITPISLEAVQKALPAGVQLVEYLRYVPFNPKPTRGVAELPRYVGYVLNSKGRPFAVDLGEAAGIDALVARLRAALSDSSNSTVDTVAAELSARVIKPLRAYLEPKDRLLICPDGDLNLVPFGALRDGADRYLIENFDVSYLTSGRDLLHLAESVRRPSGDIVVSNPDFGPTHNTPDTTRRPETRSADFDRGGFEFEPLPDTIGEARYLQQLLHLPNEQVLQGDRATEANLRALHGPRILHIATHGFFLSDQETEDTFHLASSGNANESPLPENTLLRSGLALSGANLLRSGQNDDGILTAAEVAQLDLVGTELVVLSACETGVGSIRAGDGVYGLRRALVIAGAQTQVMSLWQVRSEWTSVLMRGYYERLLKGEGRPDALIHAQRDILSDSKYRHPYYWASFIAVGNWRPLDEPSAIRTAADGIVYE